MTKTFEQGKDEIAKKVDYFRTNCEAFRDPRVKEADVRQSLIDPLFEALGWDVCNTAMVAPQYREVVPEASIEDEGRQKKPDYAFRVGQTPKFYAEAKKCAVDIDADPGPAFQLRGYGWSAKVALSMLTNFEELAVYDCTREPRRTDKAGYARTHHFRVHQYAERWRELWDVFSREAVWSGAFDQYAASKRKRGTSEVDVKFLKEIEGWRDELARSMALRNKDLSLDDLSVAVQLTIDRVVFLRMAEDRGLEPDEQLLTLCEQPDIYARFMRDVCRRADDKYNSGLFHFQKEAGVSEAPDRITPNLAVDDKVFKPILQSLYFAHGSPYRFALLPVEILGTVYERFLGKVIRLTAGHQAKVEEKPEVRKAGGVYYTPAYIVDYIVKHTVGRQIEGRSPVELAGLRDGKQPLRVLDMACGSGSFLLGAYQCLLDHCLKWYGEHKPEKHKKAVYKEPRNGHWRLTIEEKKRILTTHIFGVDIDPQAVEVSKLSLLLKVLEGESEQSLQRGLLPFSERALPNLADNIKCGNSLIGPDYFTGKIPDPEELNRVNPFDWTQGFPEAMRAGGFDCVIGNPPYVFTRNEGFTQPEKAYYYRCFRYQGRQLNTFGLFAESGYRLLRTSGLLGFITPNNWLTIDTSAPLRAFVIQKTGDVTIVNILDRVFGAAHVDTAITVLRKSDPTTLCIGEMQNGEVVARDQVSVRLVRPPAYIIQLSLLRDAKSRGVLSKIERRAKGLGELCIVSTGLKAYQTGKGTPPQTDREKAERIFHARKRVNKSYGRYLEGVDVRRYLVAWSGEYLSYGEWLAEPRRSVPFDGPRILVRQIPSKPPYLVLGALTNEAFYNDINSMVIFAATGRYSLKYFLGVINSRLLSFWFQKTYDKLQRRIFPQFKVKELGRFPIRTIDFLHTADTERHDKMERLVDSMSALHNHLAGAKSAAQKEVIQRQIDVTDAEIDRLVYDLYGLTAEEVAMVEAAKP